MTRAAATDARGVLRPQGVSCDIGAFELGGSTLAVTNTGPSSVTAGIPYSYTLAISPGGIPPSTNTTVADQLPAGITLYGATPSQGSCASGSPLTVTCNHGRVAGGATATVTLTVAEANAGPVTNAASVVNDLGVTASASAKTQVNPATAPPTLTAPTATTAAATGVTSTTATLHGQLTPGGQGTAYFFQYGPGGGYGLATAIQTTAAPAPASAALTGLNPATTYQYRPVAINSSGIAYGHQLTLTTKAATARLGISVLSAMGSKLPYRYVLSGQLKLPTGVSQAAGCAGTVTIILRAGNLKLVSNRAKINPQCRYSTTFTLTRRPGNAKHGKLQATASFPGNRALAGSTSPSITLRFG